MDPVTVWAAPQNVNFIWRSFHKTPVCRRKISLNRTSPLELRTPIAFAYSFAPTQIYRNTREPGAFQGILIIIFE